MCVFSVRLCVSWAPSSAPKDSSQLSHSRHIMLDVRHQTIASAQQQHPNQMADNDCGGAYDVLSCRRDNNCDDGSGAEPDVGDKVILRWIMQWTREARARVSMWIWWWCRRGCRILEWLSSHWHIGLCDNILIPRHMLKCWFFQCTSLATQIVSANYRVSRVYEAKRCELYIVRKYYRTVFRVLFVSTCAPAVDCESHTCVIHSMQIYMSTPWESLPVVHWFIRKRSAAQPPRLNRSNVDRNWVYVNETNMQSILFTAIIRSTVRLKAYSMI